MIFNEKDTADQFRNIATDEIIADVSAIVKKCIAAADVVNAHSNPPEFVRTIVESMLFTTGEPRLWKAMLYRSGYVHAFNGGGDDNYYAPITLYHSNDDDGTIAESIGNARNAMHGVIDIRTGSIHT